MGGQYEITVDADDDYTESNSMKIDQSDQTTHRLKSAVTKRKGRGFSSTTDAAALPTISHFDLISEETSGRSLRSVEGWVIFVRGLNEEVGEEELIDRFGEFGSVRSVRLDLDHRTGYVKGYALIEFENYSSAKAAVEEMNGAIWLETQLEADFAFIKPPPK